MIRLEVDEAERQLESIADAFADGSLDQVIVCRNGIDVALLVPPSAELLSDVAGSSGS